MTPKTCTFERVCASRREQDEGGKKAATISLALLAKLKSSRFYPNPKQNCRERKTGMQTDGQNNLSTEDIVQDLLHGGDGDALQLDGIHGPVLLWGAVIQLRPTDIHVYICSCSRSNCPKQSTRALVSQYLVKLH